MDVAWIRRLLLRELASFSRELDLFEEESLIWAVVPGISNSAGTLALHVCGNPDVLGGIRPPTGLFLLHLGTHLAHHLGQVGYLRRILTGDNQSSGAISLKALSA
jgi:hypothetical protein